MSTENTYNSSGLASLTFEGLTPIASGVFGFRAAVRVMPLIGGNKAGLEFWPDVDRKRHMSSIVAAIDIELLKYSDVSLNEEMEDVLSSALSEAYEASRKSFVYLSSTEAISAIISSGVSATEDGGANDTAEAAYNSYVRTTRNDLIEVAMKRDLNELSRVHEKGSVDAIYSTYPIAERLLFMPLWHNLDRDVDQFDEWPGVLDRWKLTMTELGMNDVVRRYMDLVDGKPWDIDETERRFNAWYKDYREKKDDKPHTSNVKSVHDFSNEALSDMGVQGRTVTTHADKPSYEDKLGRASLVNALANMLASPEQELPMTIALLGDWGAGKSSVITQLKSRLVELEEPRLYIGGSDDVCKYLHAEFNAWEYEQTDNIRAGLAQEVVNGLLKDVNWLRKLCFAFHNAWQQHRWAFGWSLIGLSVVMLSSLGIWQGSEGLFTKDNAIKGSFVGVSAAAMISFVMFNVWKTTRNILEHPLANQLQTYLKLPSYGDHLGLIPVIKEQISSMCKYRLGQAHNSRLLVVVDDLDRCSPECITETLDAVRLVMNLDNVVVLIAIDDRVAFRAVADHYEKLSDKDRSSAAIARDYLGKIVQLPINIPVPDSHDMTRFINEGLFVHASKLIQETVGGGVDFFGEPSGVAENKKGATNLVATISKSKDGPTTVVKWPDVDGNGGLLEV